MGQRRTPKTASASRRTNLSSVSSTKFLIRPSSLVFICVSSCSSSLRRRSCASVSCSVDARRACAALSSSRVMPDFSSCPDRKPAWRKGAEEEGVDEGRKRGRKRWRGG